jgi:hypothetical protein
MAPPDRPGPPHDPDIAALERLRHVVPRVCELWEQDGFDVYVNGLIADSRDGARQGFPADVQAELMFLIELRIAKRALVWSENAGLPFKEVFLQYLEKAQKTAVVTTPEKGAWADPHARQSMGRIGRQDSERGRPAPTAAQASHSSRSRPPKKSWWKRLFG